MFVNPLFCTRCLAPVLLSQSSVCLAQALCEQLSLPIGLPPRTTRPKPKALLATGTATIRSKLPQMALQPDLAAAVMAVVETIEWEVEKVGGRTGLLLGQPEG